MPAIIKAQTTKQAKAAFKTRGQPVLTEKEQRQLTRSIELEARAERAREAERRRTEAVKKRAESCKPDQAAAERARLGTQRRYDRFGFKASQFHLGAFFGTADTAGLKRPRMGALAEEQGGVQDDDMFEDGDLDDAILLEAFDTPMMSGMSQHRIRDLSASDTALMPSPGRRLKEASPSLQREKSLPGSASSLICQEDLIAFWDELDSSTQVARDLDTTKPQESAVVGKVSRSDSFSSSDFDLTAEDLDELDPPRQPMYLPTATEPTLQRPGPAALPTRPCRDATLSNVPKSLPAQAPFPTPHRHPRNAPIPTRPVIQKPMVAPLPTPRHQQPYAEAQIICKRTQDGMAPQTVASGRKSLPETMQESFVKPTLVTLSHQSRKSIQKKPANVIRGPFLPASSLYCSPKLGFTLSQLEIMIEDDVQLTQAVPR